MQTGIAYMNATTPEQALIDVRAAVDAVARAGRVGVVGYCWGGYVAALKACRGNIAAAVAYYGGGLPRLLDDAPDCPLMLHFGEHDSHIPLSDVDAGPQGLARGDRAHLSGRPRLCLPGPCRLRTRERSGSPRERTVEFFRKHVG